MLLLMLLLALSSYVDVVIFGVVGVDDIGVVSFIVNVDDVVFGVLILLLMLLLLLSLLLRLLLCNC